MSEPRVEVKGERRDSQRCPFCHAALGELEAIWPCPVCATSQHRECAAELGRCSSLGCKGELPREPEVFYVNTRAPMEVMRATSPAASEASRRLVNASFAVEAFAGAILTIRGVQSFLSVGLDGDRLYHRFPTLWAFFLVFALVLRLVVGPLLVERAVTAALRARHGGHESRFWHRRYLFALAVLVPVLVGLSLASLVSMDAARWLLWASLVTLVLEFVWPGRAP